MAAAVTSSASSFKEQEIMAGSIVKDEDSAADVDSSYTPTLIPVNGSDGEKDSGNGNAVEAADAAVKGIENVEGVGDKADVLGAKVWIMLISLSIVGFLMLLDVSVVTTVSPFPILRS